MESNEKTAAAINYGAPFSSPGFNKRFSVDCFLHG